MRNVSMTCPNCGTKERAVGDPDEGDQGHTGKWYCFVCKHSGTYAIAFVDDSTGQVIKAESA